jgi:8-oxo-dGTP pyrophosphatase MutT (NUDIX family)
MELARLVDFLHERLQKPLPGIEASRLMMPYLPNGTRLRMQHDGPVRESAVMILLYEQEGMVRFPLIQRPTYPGVHSGQMALPGGKRDDSDPDLVFTALRESEEEIGVKSSDIQVVGALSSFYLAASHYQVLPVIGFVPEVPVLTPQKSEVDEIVQARLAHLVADEFQKEKDIVVAGGVTLRSPYFDLEGKIVWGATAMMLSELKQLLTEWR